MSGGLRLVGTVQRLWPFIVLSLGLLIIVAITSAVDDRLLDRTVTEALIRVVIVVGLYIFIGNSGILSFGHIGFTAIGAYAVAWQTCCPALKEMKLTGLPEFLRHATFPLFPSALISGLLASAVAFLIGLALMRLRGLAAAIGTFSFLAIVHITYSNWESVTAGTSSLIGIPLYVDAWVALAWAVAAIATAQLYQISRFGLALRATREDEFAAMAAGVNVIRERVIAFTISAFFAGIGGVLHAHFIGALMVNSFWLQLTFITLAMLVVGGMNSLTGAVAGVVTLSTLIEILRQFEKGVQIAGATLSIPSGGQEIGLAVVMLAILLFRQGGLTQNREIPWPWQDSRNVARTAAKKRGRAER